MGYYIKSRVNLVLKTGILLTGATSVKVLYKKPSQAVGEWAATALDKNIHYTITETDITEPGTWSFQAFAIIDGKTYHGDTQTQLFLNTLN